MDRTYWRGARLAAALSLAGLMLAACGGDSGGSTSAAPTEEEEPSTTRECSTEGSTKACTCASGGAGRKTCKNGVYGNCTSCMLETSADAGPREAPSQSKCRAGYYTGEFTGKYKPGAFGFGIGEGFLEVDVAGAMSNGRPALALTLEESVMNSGGEFFTFTVGNGCMTGVAQAVGTSNPFVARLSGDLDCSTGAFVGTLEGKYTLLDVMGLEFSFKGPLTAQFDLKESALKDGEWSVDEPPALLGDRAGGGSGTWGATWSAMNAPDTGDDPCKGIVSTGPADAGESSNRDAGAGSPDAGVP